MKGDVLLTIVYDNLKFVIQTDIWTDEKLWVVVYDGDNMLANEFLWLLDKNFDVVKTHWKHAARFNWNGLKWSKSKPYFSEEIKRKLDSYFKLKAFW